MQRAMLAVAVACAAVPAAAQGVRVKLPAWVEPVLLDSMRQEHEVKADPALVYRAVLDAYRGLAIPTGNTDGTRGIVGSERFEKIHSLAGAPMSRSFGCGESATGPNADAFRLTIAIVTWVKPRDGGTTTLAVAAAASGHDVGGVYRIPIKCASTGRMETKILEWVEKFVRR